MTVLTRLTPVIPGAINDPGIQNANRPLTISEIDSNFSDLYNFVLGKLSKSGDTLTGNLDIVGGFSLTGNATFSGTAQRFLIKTDGAQADRFAFQSTATNGNTRLWIYPSGTGNITGVAGHTSASDFTNYNAFDLAVLGGASQEVRLSSNAAGTATAYPITFRIGASEQMRLNTTGLGIGTTPEGKLHAVTSGSSTQYLFDSTITSGTFGFAIRSTGESGSAYPILGIAQWRSSFPGNQNVGQIRFDGLTTAGTYTTFAEIYATATGANSLTGAATSLAFRTSDGTGQAQERMLLTSSGNLGIGATPTYAKLQVNATSLGTNALLSLSTNDGTYNPRAIISHITSTTSQYINFTSTFSTGTGFANWIFASGNVGIGLSDPGSKLEIYGSGNLVRLGDGTSTHDLRFQGPNNWDLQLNTTTDVFSVRRNSVSFLSVNSDGSSVTRNVFISNASSSRPALAYSNWGYSSAYKTLVIGSTSTAYNTDVTGAITVSFNYDPSANTNSAFSGDGREILFRRGTRFVTPNAADTSFNLYNLVMIDGNVGIGTDNPATNLDVRGTTSATIRVGSTGNGGSGDEFGNLEFYWADPDAAEVKAKIYAKNVGNVGPGGGGAADLLFATRPASGTLDERARITSGGAFVVNNTSGSIGSEITLFKQTGGAGSPVTRAWNSETSGNNEFIEFGTEGTYTNRGGITYNRAGGLVAYNTTSDYRAKDIIGPVQNVGATIDALKVYEGVMKGATQSRPMLIAHEAQQHAPYAVSGVKDEMNEDGTPKFQQMDVSSLVPLLLAEIQSLRARVAALEAQ